MRLLLEVRSDVITLLKEGGKLENSSQRIIRVGKVDDDPKRLTRFNEFETARRVRKLTDACRDHIRGQPQSGRHSNRSAYVVKIRCAQKAGADAEFADG